MAPIELLNTWITEEQRAGAPNPLQAVLATCGKDAIPHARVVAIREIDERGLLFFTQKGTRKFNELISNPLATITFWFELFQREVIIEGTTSLLPNADTQIYWNSYPREAQIRFYSYAPTSSQPIANKDILEEKRQQITQAYDAKTLPLSDYYCGFRLKPSRILFYAYRTDELSDVFEYHPHNNTWRKQWLSP